MKVYSYEYTIFFAPRWKLVYMRTLEKRIQVRSRVMNEQMVQEEKIVGVQIKICWIYFFITITCTGILQCYK